MQQLREEKRSELRSQLLRAANFHECYKPAVHLLECSDAGGGSGAGVEGTRFSQAFFNWVGERKWGVSAELELGVAQPEQQRSHTDTEVFRITTRQRSLGIS